jgi:hypothetical protein
MANLTLQSRTSASSVVTTDQLYLTDSTGTSEKRATVELLRQNILASSTSDDLPEGASKLFHTQTRARTAVGGYVDNNASPVAGVLYDSSKVNALFNGIVNANASTTGSTSNIRFTTTVISGTLTITASYIDGTAMSLTKKGYVRISDTVYEITNNITLTFNTGTNWFNGSSLAINTQKFELFIYFFYNSNNFSIEMSCARVPYFINSTERNTVQTGDRYAPIKGDAGFGGNPPLTTDAWVVVGRVAVKQTSNIWQTQPTEAVVGSIKNTTVLTSATGLVNAVYISGATSYVYQVMDRTLIKTCGIITFTMTATGLFTYSSPFNTIAGNQYSPNIWGQAGTNLAGWEDFAPASSVFQCSTNYNGGNFTSGTTYIFFACQKQYLL